jgi:hypothetical protein
MNGSTREMEMEKNIGAYDKFAPGGQRCSLLCGDFPAIRASRWVPLQKLLIFIFLKGFFSIMFDPQKELTHIDWGYIWGYE